MTDQAKLPPYAKSLRSRFSLGQLAARFLLCLLMVGFCAWPPPAFGAFGLTTTASLYTVDTGAGLVFSVRRTDPPASLQSAGDIASLVWNGTEYQDQTRGSHIGSGLGTATVSGTTIGPDLIKITVTGSGIEHHYLVRRDQPIIYMVTHATPDWTFGELRWITRLNGANLPNRPPASNTDGTTTTIESGDVFGLPNGETRSKYYGNSRAMELPLRGVTGDGVGIFMAFGDRETSSGGPFFRDIQHQSVETYNYMNSGHNQTEAFRYGLHAPYALVFTAGPTPPAPPDFTWMESAGLNLLGWVPATSRGAVSGTATGVPAGFQAVVGFANATAQYWTVVTNGIYHSPRMKPGTYNVTLYKQELAVATSSINVSAGVTNTLNLVSTEANPPFIFRFGDWDGTPSGFLNAANLTHMHPSDVRHASWATTDFTVETNPAPQFPAIQARQINGNLILRFNLTPAQASVGHTVRIGITCAYIGGRPKIDVNGWQPGNPAISSQPSSRSFTIGTYRGNNWLYTFNVPASAFVAGQNVLSIFPISGSSDLGGWLSAGYVFDCIQLDGTPIAPPAPVNLTAAPTDSHLNLTWTPVFNAASYRVKRATTPGGPYTTVTTNLVTELADLTALPNTPYYYVVSSMNVTGESANSAQVAAAFVTPPTSLSATPLVPGTINLAWDASPLATNYLVKRATTSTGPYTVIATNATTSYTDSGVPGGATYYYVVSAATTFGPTANSAEAAVAALPTLRTYLQFDEASGAVAADATGNGWAGSLINAPVRVAGYSNNAVNLSSGASQHVTLPAGLVDGLETATLAAWVKLTTSSGWARIFDFGTGPTVNLFLTPQNGENNTLRFAITTNGGGAAEQRINGPTALPLGVWKHVAVTLNGPTGILYVDGVPVGTNTTMTLRPGSLGVTTQNYIGRSQYPDPYFNGQVDEFRIYGGALTPGEVATLITPLAAPANLSATAGDEQVGLSWQTVANANYYQILRALSTDGPYAPVATVMTPNFTDTGLANGTNYFYLVQAGNSVGSSGNSIEVSARPVSTAPTNLAATQFNGALTLAWPATHLGWRLQVQTNALTTGLNSNWFDVPGATTTNSVTLPVDSNHGSVFYRLIYP
jgi:rhamnogalacturonan endolyase